jgi:hypothetical protein
MTSKSILSLVILIFFASSSAWAATTSYNATSAAADPTLTSHSGGHSIWIGGFAGKLGFDPGAKLTLNDNNSATHSDDVWNLFGVIRKGNIAFDVNFTFSGIENYASAAGHLGTPKLDMYSSAYVAPFGTGGPVDPSIWLYAEVLTGTLTGLAGSVYDGAVLQASMRGPHGQFGYGANGKNLNLGFSNWMDLTLTTQACSGCLQLASQYVGDVNARGPDDPGAFERAFVPGGWLRAEFWHAPTGALIFFI